MLTLKSTPHAGVSSKDIQKARKNAQRSRTAVACFRCKVGKVKCSDYRPCKNCASYGRECSNLSIVSEFCPSETIDGSDFGAKRVPTISLDCYAISEACPAIFGSSLRSFEVKGAIFMVSFPFLI